MYFIFLEQKYYHNYKLDYELESGQTYGFDYTAYKVDKDKVHKKLKIDGDPLD